MRKGTKGEGNTAVLADLPDPVAGPGELVVRMMACGLCGTDIEKLRGEYTAAMPVLGHEAVGVVEEVGGGADGFKQGDRVFPHHHVPCGECHYCKAGSPTMCDRYRSSNLDPGGFAELIRVPSWNLLKGGVLRIPQSLDFEGGALIEPVACCIRALDRCGVASGTSALVVGAGPVGLAHAILLRSQGVEVLVSDVSDWRLKFAERLGVGRPLDARSPDVSDEVRQQTGGRGVDLVVVASGSPKAIVQALKSVRKGGAVCLFGIPPQGSVLDYDIADVYNSEVSIVTSYGATDVETKRAVELMASGKVDFRPLVTHRFPLERFGEAIEASASGQGIKVLVTP